MIEGPRAARDEGEIHAAAALADSVFYPDGTGDMGSWFPTLFHPGNRENLRVFVDDGRPVALAGFTVNDIVIHGARLRAACAGAVCTAPSHQGRGLASRLMEDLVARAREQGAQLLLVSGARHLYVRMGCVDAGLYRTAVVERGSAPPAGGCEVREATAADVPELAAALCAEPVRFVRSPDEWRLLLESRVLQCKPSRTWVAAFQGAAGYLCAQEPREEGGARVIKVLEIAGPRACVLAALAGIFRETGADRISIEMLDADHELRALCEAHGLPTLCRGFPGTVKIIDPRGLFDALGPWIEQRLTSEEARRFSIDTDHGVVFRLGGEKLAASSDAEVTARVFGSLTHAAADPGATALGRLLARLFPVPLVGYGLSYI